MLRKQATHFRSNREAVEVSSGRWRQSRTSRTTPRNIRSTHVDRATNDHTHRACSRVAPTHAHDQRRFAAQSQLS
jgi:hypothetical protein